jgi:hypothetical protein
MSNSAEDFNTIFDEEERAALQTEMSLNSIRERRPDFDGVVTEEVARKIMADSLLLGRVTDAKDFTEETYIIAKEMTMADALDEDYGSGKLPGSGPTSLLDILGE